MNALPLFRGETMFWQDQPEFRAVARSVFHVHWVALYFALLIIAGAVTDRMHGLSSMETLSAEATPAGFAMASCVILVLLAWMTARTTCYTITDRRVVLRFGIALSVTLSLPLRTIGSVAVRVDEDHSGDIPLVLRPGERVRYLKLWPLARPWRFLQAQPMLRAVPRAGMVAALLSRTLVIAQRQALGELRLSQSNPASFAATAQSPEAPSQAATEQAFFLPN